MCFVHVAIIVSFGAAREESLFWSRIKTYLDLDCSSCEIAREELVRFFTMCGCDPSVIHVYYNK